MKRIVIALLAVAVCLFWSAPALAQTATQQIRIEDSGGHPIAAATVTLYVHGQAHITANIVATGTTDADGYVQPAPVLTPGTVYDFVTTDGRVPAGQFTAIAPTQLNLIPGHGATTTTAPVTLPSVNGSLNIPIGDVQAFPPNSFIALVDNVNALIPPTAPGVSAVAGTSTVAQTIYVVTTYLNGSAGQTTVSPQSGVALTTAQQAQVVSPAAAVNAVNYDVYAGTVSGGPYYLQNASPVTIGTNFTIPGTLLTATAPPTANSTAHAAYGFITATNAASSTITATIQSYGGGAGAGTTFTSGSALTFGGQPPITGCSTNCAITNADNNFGATQTIHGNVAIPAAGTATSGANFGSLGSVQLNGSSWNGTAAVAHNWTINTGINGNLNILDDRNGTQLKVLDNAGGGILQTGTTTLGPNAFNFATALGSMETGQDSSSGVGGSWELQWLTNESTPDSWGWWINGSNGGNLLAAHSLNLSYYPADTTVGSSFPAMSITPNASNHDELDASGGSVTFYAPTQFNSNVTSAGSFIGSTTYSGNAGSAIMQANGSSGHIVLENSTGAAIFDALTGGATLTGVFTATSFVAGATGYGFGSGGNNALGLEADASGNLYMLASGGKSYTFNSTTGNLALQNSGSYTTGSSVYGATTASVNGSLTALGSIHIPGNASILFDQGTAAPGQIGVPGSGTTVQGVQCTNLGVANASVAWRWCMDTSGNVGAAGNVTANTFFTGSRSEWKMNITPYRFDPLELLAHTHYAEYDCRTSRCGPPGEHKVGIIANDSPVQITGPNHDHYDGFTMAAIDGKAITELAREVESLRRAVHAMCRLPQNRRLKECARR